MWGEEGALSVCRALSSLSDSLAALEAADEARVVEDVFLQSFFPFHRLQRSKYQKCVRLLFFM